MLGQARRRLSDPLRAVAGSTLAPSLSRFLLHSHAAPSSPLPHALYLLHCHAEEQCQSSGALPLFQQRARTPSFVPAQSKGPLPLIQQSAHAPFLCSSREHAPFLFRVADAGALLLPAAFDHLLDLQQLSTLSSPISCSKRTSPSVSGSCHLFQQAIVDIVIDIIVFHLLQRTSSPTSSSSPSCSCKQLPFQVQMRVTRSARGSTIISHVGGSSSSSRNIEADVVHMPYYVEVHNDQNDNNCRLVGNEDVEDDDGHDDGVADEPKDCPGSSSRHRGSNTGLQVQENLEGRKQIEISIGKRNKFTSDKPARYITVKFKELVHGPYRHWKDVPQNVRDQIWNRFKMVFTWPEHMEEGIFNAFNISARNTWNGELFQARENAAKNSGSKEPKEWIDYPPNWIFKDDWKNLCEFYASDEFKKKSDIGKRNRRSSKNESMSTHTGGSISFDTHEDRWIQEHNGVPPSNLELFLRVHRKNKGNGEFVDIKSKKTVDAYNNILQNKYGESESQDIKWDGDAWAEAIGPPSKGQVYGFGTMSDPGVVLGPKYARNNKRIMRAIESQEDMEARIAAQLRPQLMEQLRKEMQNEMMDMFLRYGVQSGGAQPFGNLLQGNQLQVTQLPMTLPFSFPQLNLGGSTSHGYFAQSQLPEGQFASQIFGQSNPYQLLGGGLPGAGQGLSLGVRNTQNGSDAGDTNG